MLPGTSVLLDRRTTPTGATPSSPPGRVIYRKPYRRGSQKTSRTVSGVCTHLLHGSHPWTDRREFLRPHTRIFQEVERRGGGGAGGGRGGAGAGAGVPHGVVRVRRLHGAADVAAARAGGVRRRRALHARVAGRAGAVQSDGGWENTPAGPWCTTRTLFICPTDETSHHRLSLALSALLSFAR